MSFDAFGLILQAGLIVKLVLLILVVFSVVSWGIIVSKWRELRGASEDSEAFLEIYHDEPFSAVYDAAQDLDRSPSAIIFVSTCDEMSRIAQQSGLASIHEIEAPQMRQVTKRLSWLSSRETQRLERGLSFLATTGSAAPFIGLFGTVWGIMDAFHGIGTSGSASLAVVAPGISEALVATAIGLVAAIPAVIGYNHFVNKVNVLLGEMDNFSQEMLNIVQRMSRGN